MFQWMLLKCSFLPAEIHALVLYLFPAALTLSVTIKTRRLGGLRFLLFFATFRRHVNTEAYGNIKMLPPGSATWNPEET